MVPVILEGIVTTIDDEDRTHIAPMGPNVDRSISRLCLRPYQGSTTLRNLRRLREGVFHVTDDVELLARAAVGRAIPPPPLVPADAVRGRILADACRWYAFRVVNLDEQSPRATLDCQIVDSGRIRDFFGFNRAKHAVVEAAILATRVRWLPRQQILAQMEHLAILVEKTAGDQERRAFEFLQAYVQNESKTP
jgi:hypothetical protein